PSFATKYWLLTPQSDRIVPHPKGRDYNRSETSRKVGDRTVIVRDNVVIVSPRGTEVFARPRMTPWPPTIFERPDGRLYSMSIDPFGNGVFLRDLARESDVAKWSYDALQGALAARSCKDDHAGP